MERAAVSAPPDLRLGRAGRSEGVVAGEGHDRVQLPHLCASRRIPDDAANQNTVAVAIDYVEDGMWNDPEYLESVRRYGQQVRLGEAGSQTVALKLISP